MLCLKWESHLWHLRQLPCRKNWISLAQWYIKRPSNLHNHYVRLDTTKNECHEVGDISMPSLAVLRTPKWSYLGILRRAVWCLGCRFTGTRESIISLPKGLHPSCLSGAYTSPSLLLTGPFTEPHYLSNVVENRPTLWPSNLRSEQVKAEGDVWQVLRPKQGKRQECTATERQEGRGRGELRGSSPFQWRSFLIWLTFSWELQLWQHYGSCKGKTNVILSLIICADNQLIVGNGFAASWKIQKRPECISDPSTPIILTTSLCSKLIFMMLK